MWGAGNPGREAAGDAAPVPNFSLDDAPDRARLEELLPALPFDDFEEKERQEEGNAAAPAVDPTVDATVATAIPPDRRDSDSWDDMSHGGGL